MGWPVSTASPRAFRNGTLQLDKSLARLMPRPARRLTPSSSTRRDSAHDATDMQQRDAARPYFDAARLRTPPTPHDDWHRAARRGATPHAPDSARRLAPSSSTRRDSARPPTPHGATGAEQLAPSAPPLPFPSKKKKRKRWIRRFPVSGLVWTRCGNTHKLHAPHARAGASDTATFSRAQLSLCSLRL